MLISSYNCDVRVLPRTSQAPRAQPLASRHRLKCWSF